MKPLTKEQSVVISAYTGFLICEFSDMHEYIERIMDRPVLVHEMASEKTMAEIREAAKEDFIALAPEVES